MAEILVARSMGTAALALFDARDDVSYEVLATPTVGDLEARIAGLDAIVLGMTPFTGEGVGRMARASVQNCLDAIDGRLRPGYVVNKEVLGG
jgi:hypothetical protein